MDADKSVTAVFVKTYTLTVTISPGAGGTVSPAGGIFDAGANVTLTATPADGYSFSHWEGDASGTDTSITITMDADKSVTAVFNVTTGTGTMAQLARSDATLVLNNVYSSEAAIIAKPNEKISLRQISSHS